MRKTLLIFLLGINSLFALEFYSYDVALKLQEQSHKIIMLDVIRSDCHYCSDMDKNVFKDPKMSEYLKERFIPVKINLDNEELPLGIEVHFTPTFFFINGKQEILKTIPGSWNIQDFTDLTKNIK